MFKIFGIATSSLGTQGPVLAEIKTYVGEIKT
jgi:hypothetical protein